MKYFILTKNLQVDDSVPMINCLICREGYPMNEMTAHQQKTHSETFQAVKVILLKTMLKNTAWSKIISTCMSVTSK